MTTTKRKKVLLKKCKVIMKRIKPRGLFSLPRVCNIKKMSKKELEKIYPI